MMIGDVVPARNIVINFDPLPKGQSGLIRESFSAPKKQKFMLLLLGTKEDGKPFDPESALNELGWCRKEPPQRSGK